MSGVDEGRALNPWDVLMVWWTARRVGRRIGGDWWRSPLNWTGDHFCRDDPLRLFLALFGCMDARQCISLYIPWTGAIGALELETGKKKCPPGLTRIEPFSITEVL